MIPKLAVSPLQAEFIDFLVKSSALKFGEFVLKSGRNAPYFINTGSFDSGSTISALGRFYARHIVESGIDDARVIFGPAYKGISLAVTTSVALFTDYALDLRFCFDRKETKTHGDAGKMVGVINQGDKVVLVEDVITAGTTLKTVVPVLHDQLGAKIIGVVIAVDRCERGSGVLSAVQEAEEVHGISIFPLVTIHHIWHYLSTPNNTGFVISEEQSGRINRYLSQYGA